MPKGLVLASEPGARLGTPDRPSGSAPSSSGESTAARPVSADAHPVVPDDPVREKMTMAAQQAGSEGSEPPAGTTTRAVSGSMLAQLIEHTFIELQPGQRLPSERELAQQFSVGRPLVREALRTLVERGVVDVQVGRGTFVRRVTPGDAARPVDNLLRRQAITARQLIEARSMLESEASQLACRRATPADLEHMRDLVAVGSEESLAAKVRNDLEFHLSIVRAAHNPVIETMFTAILLPTAEMMMRSLSDPYVSHEGLPYHEQMFLAISSRDESAAGSAARGHLGVSERMYGADLDVELDVLVRRRIIGAGRAFDRDGLSADDVLSSVLQPFGGL
jgi:GntR family transcriptional repressor for pyruvate dehydrogenase complex